MRELELVAWIKDAWKWNKMKNKVLRARILTFRAAK
jgi:hypothetical protein